MSDRFVAPTRLDAAVDRVVGLLTRAGLPLAGGVSAADIRDS